MPIEENMVNLCIIWLGHARKRSIEVLNRRVDCMEDSSKIKDKGRPRKLLLQVKLAFPHGA
jgi:hypothetical protein